MNPVRRHGKFMKNRAEKAGGYVKKKRKIVVGILAALLCMTTGAYGYFSDRLEVKNHITMGDIRINMTEFARKGNGEVKYRDPAYIFRVNGFQRFHVLRTVLSHVGYGHVSVTEATKRMSKC